MKVIVNKRYETPRSAADIHGLVNAIPKEYENLAYAIAGMTNNLIASQINPHITHLEHRIRELESELNVYLRERTRDCSTLTLMKKQGD